MADFLLELLSEEIPARMQAKASADFARLFEARIGEAGLSAVKIETFATPRRLALIARGLPAETEKVREERKGPRADAPEAAIAGFLRSTGLAREQLEEREDKKGGRTLFAVVERPGRSALSVLAEAIPEIVRDFPWPKSMRWGEASSSTSSLRWVRPLQGILALLGEEMVPFDVGGVRSGAATVGHRFHHPGAITIGSAQDYVEKLRACHVILDPAERRRIIADGAARAAAEAGVTLVEDEGLLHENAGLTEWPVPLLGSFDPAFLDVPREVIQLTMRTNQKYFACTDREGRLAPNFVCVANIEPSDGGAGVVDGNRKVLAARLADARFFWEQDLKVPLEAQAAKLSGIVFHEQLGSIGDKALRIEKLAGWMVERRLIDLQRRRPAREGAWAVPGMSDEERVALAKQVRTAARLAKADLLTQMVGEFPELQGVIGGYLARAQGQGDAVADAVRDHYKPVGQQDEVPESPVTVAVALADKIDTLAAFFAIDEKPSGSRDPFALRRAALGVLQIITRRGLRLPLRDVLIQAAVLVKLSRLGALSSATFPNLSVDVEGEHEITAEVGSFTYRCGGTVVVRWDSASTPLLERGRFIEEARDVEEELFAFFIDRLKVQQRDAGVRHDLIDAVFALRAEEDLIRLLDRVQALQAFVETEEGADLLAGYKRAANILKKEGWEGQGRDVFFSYEPEDDETALDSALDRAEPAVAEALKREDFADAMAILSSLRTPIDRFFDNVTVNDPDPEKRKTRLILLARIRSAVHRVADFSRIEG
ncbi:glycine--tRNA ligase subunit beta [Sphingosinicella sp. CPCC 101087]|uniref:glycine--tRNA ligase subunit beta n=1 Tax=Sphingosinicella sp. CPCC 101087 TaxID=2497754 RepID=UPI00101D2069|nr:glycine--tRNA ligase subunit beta [Sphingosinicella sp. CPCC 101087]